MEQKTMKAAVIEEVGKLSIHEVPVPEISNEDILLKVDACGICGSDLRILSNGNKRINYPQILGHEITGTVVEVGNNQFYKFSMGDKISLSADIPCGNCVWCLKGLSNHCNNNLAFGYEYAGGFAEYIKLDSRILNYGPLYILPKENFCLEQVALAEPLSCCINGAEICRLGKGDDVLIYGAGPIGSILTRLAKAKGANSVVLCDTDYSRLESAKKCNADRYILFNDSELGKASKDITGGTGFNVIFTACPAIEAQESAINYVRQSGVINFFGGLSPNARNISFSSNILHYKEVTLLGSHGSTPKHHRTAVKMLLDREIVLEDLISKKFKLEDISLAFDESFNNKQNLKILIMP